VERRLAITYIVSATTTLGIGSVAIAVLGGGLFVSAAPIQPGSKQVEVVDDYIVIHSSTTTLVPVDPALLPVDTTAAPASDSAIARVRAPSEAASPDAGDASAAAPAPVDGDASEPVQSPVTAAPPIESPDPAPAPAPTAAPKAAPAPTAPPESPSPTAAPAPAPTSAAPTPTTPPAAAPATRPPIPEGCIDPRFRNGTWKCDDD